MRLKEKRTVWDWTFFCLATVIFLGFCLTVSLGGAPGKTALNLGNFTLPSGRFITFYMMTWLSFFTAFLVFPQGIQAKHGMAVIIILSVLARVAMLPLLESDDVNRYLWEGFLVLKGISPYHHAPNAPELSLIAKDFVFFSGINHPDISAAYPPLLLFFFSMLNLVSMDPMTIKIAMALLDVIAVYLLMCILKHRDIDVRWAFLYALNPLVLVSFAGEGHGDVLQTVFFLAALCMYDKKHHGLMYLFLGLAVQAKLVSILVFPFFFTRKNRWFAPLFFLTVILPFTPFMGEGVAGLMDGLTTFGKDFAFNGPIQSLLEALGTYRHIARIACGTLFFVFVITAVVIYRPGGIKNLENSPIPGSFAVLGALILLSPTVHAWYLCWVFPLAVIRQSWSWLILTFFICFYYVAPGMVYLGELWGLPVWAILAQWIPFGGLFAIECLFVLIRWKHMGPDQPAKTVSVVIPTINENQAIGDCIRRCLSDPSVIEVLVVDGGSTDNTQDIACEAGAVVLNHPNPPHNGGGRGGQIKRGVNQSRGDVVAVVHADTHVIPGTFTRVVSLLKNNPQVSGGAVGSQFDHLSLRLKIIESLNTLRAAFFSLSFGDQIQFFRRHPMVSQNRYPDIPLMEDVELSLQLLKLGKTSYLFGESTVSSRRWNTRGITNAFTVLHYFLAYLITRPWKKPDTVDMYHRYYGN